MAEFEEMEDESEEEVEVIPFWKENTESFRKSQEYRKLAVENEAARRSTQEGVHLFKATKKGVKMHCSLCHSDKQNKTRCELKGKQHPVDAEAGGSKAKGKGRKRSSSSQPVPSTENVTASLQAQTQPSRGRKSKKSRL